jgi:hypothetical protein
MKEFLMKYSVMSREALVAEKEKLECEYKTYLAKGLSLDLSRGKPGHKQLDLMTGMLDCISKNEDCRSKSGIDYRNYGLLDGVPEAKKLFSDLLDIPEKNIFVAGNSSLNLMFSISKSFCAIIILSAFFSSINLSIP